MANNQNPNGIELDVSSSGFSFRNLKLKHLLYLLPVLFISSEVYFGFYVKSSGPFFYYTSNYFQPKDGRLLKRNIEISKLSNQSEANSKLISNWKLIESLSSSAPIVIDIKHDIEGAVRLYKQVDFKVLDDRQAIAYFATLAQLCVIFADKTRNYSDLECAKDSLERLERVHDDGTKDIKDVEYITKHKPLQKIKITWLNIAAFENVLNPSPSSKLNAEKWKIEFGGCKSLENEQVRHRDIYRGLGCNYP